MVRSETRITIHIDDVVLEEFRSRAEKLGSGYQTMMDEELKASLAGTDERPLTESVLRRVIREELPACDWRIRERGRLAVVIGANACAVACRVCRFRSCTAVSDLFCTSGGLWNHWVVERLVHW